MKKLRKYRPSSLCFKEEEGTLGTRNPYIDVGEYLPEMDSEEEIEIVKICLASVTGDVYSIRISEDNGIYYVSVVDEYGTDFIDFKVEYDQIPTQGEIFDVIVNMNYEVDGVPYWLDLINNNEFESIEEIIDFIQIDSWIYPDLDQLFEAYLKENDFS